MDFAVGSSKRIVLLMLSVTALMWGCADSTAARLSDPDTGATLGPQRHLFSHKARSSKAMRKLEKGADAVADAAGKVTDDLLDGDDDGVALPAPRGKRHDRNSEGGR